MLFQVVLTLEFENALFKYGHSNRKAIATDQYFPVLLFIILYKMLPKFESVDEILTCGHFLMRATKKYFLVVLFYAVQMNF